MSTDERQRHTQAVAEHLIGLRSVTPDDGGACDWLAARLRSAGFACERFDRGLVRNLWARHGTEAPLVVLAGHVDVVPPGPVSEWTSDPFVATVRDSALYGRGAADMKGPLAAMVTAAERIAGGAHAGSVALLVTSDEEGEAVDGTAAVVEALQARGERVTACILGEPTSTEVLGDTLKHGRRGSLNGSLTVRGEQCHIAYPERGRNPIHSAMPAIVELTRAQWDEGHPHFPATSFQVSNVHAGTGAVNVIPGALRLLFNIRFSPASTVESLTARVHHILDAHHLDYTLDWNVSGLPFVTPPGALVDALSRAVQHETGVTPALSTSGGTSDGRFLAHLADEVVEFGPVNATIHKVDEHIRLDDLGRLSAIYERAVRARLG